MLRVGLTGGVATGKSTVAGMFAALGAQVIDADQIVHELYRPGEGVHRKLVEHFGAGIVRPDGEIDRTRLAALVFDCGRVEELNRIVHPAVFRRQQEWIEQATKRAPDGVAIVETALILEAGGKDRYEKMIVVTCRPEQKIARYAQRAGIADAEAHAEVERRSKVQMSDAEKASFADYVIDNSGTLEAARQQTQKIYGELKTLAELPVSDR